MKPTTKYLNISDIYDFYDLIKIDYGTANVIKKSYDESYRKGLDFTYRFSDGINYVHVIFNYTFKSRIPFSFILVEPKKTPYKLLDPQFYKVQSIEVGIDCFAPTLMPDLYTSYGFDIVATFKDTVYNTFHSVKMDSVYTSVSDKRFVNIANLNIRGAFIKVIWLLDNLNTYINDEYTFMIFDDITLKECKLNELGSLSAYYLQQELKERR
jgi:hypothetical protein